MTTAPVRRLGLLAAVAAAVLALLLLGADQAWAAEGLPNPTAEIPDDVYSRVSTLLGWGKWIAFMAGVAGLIVSGTMMALGRRNRSQLAADGAVGVPWAIAGVALVLMATPLVTALIG